MSVHKCSTCFYHKMPNDSVPCVGCTGYANWIHEDTFKEPEPLTKPDFNTLSQSVNNWFLSEDAGYRVVDDYDIVTKPKHYMLFAADELHKDQGIEVRDVIEKLVEKLDNQAGQSVVPYAPLFTPDYVQLMQYLMRFMDKNGVEDLKKASWYLDKMIQAYDGDGYESYV